MESKKNYIILAAILLSGIFLRIIYFNNEIFTGSDAVYYSRLGKNLIESGKYVFGENFNWGTYFPPGYSLFIGAVNLLVKDLFFSAKLVSLLSSVITIFLFYLIGKEIYNKESGLFAAFVYAVHPVILKFSVTGMSEALFFCFLFLSIYLFIISAKKDNLIIHVLLGISIAISCLIRTEGLLLLLMPSLHLFGVFGYKPVLNKRNLLKISLLLCFFILISLPYMLFIKDYTGKLTLSGKSNIVLLAKEMKGGKELGELMNCSGNLYEKKIFSLNESKTNIMGFEENAQVSIIDYIFGDPVYMVRKYIKNVLEQIKIMIKFLIPIILPLFFSFFKKDLFKNKMRLIFLLIPFFYFPVYPLIVIMERNILIIFLSLLLFSSIGFTNSVPAFSRIMGFYGIKANRVTLFLERNIKYLIITIFIISTSMYPLFSNINKIQIQVEHIEAGYFLKNSVSSEYEKLNVMSKEPFVSFYSGSRFTMIPYANSIETVDFAKLYNVDYIVVSERYIGDWEYYEELLELDKHSDEVELAYEAGKDKLIRLFRINPVRRH